MTHPSLLVCTAQQQYAQSGYGEPGVTRAIQILEDEIHRGMRLLGVSSLDQLTPEMVDILPRAFYPMPKQPDERS